MPSKDYAYPSYLTAENQQQRQRTYVMDLFKSLLQLKFTVVIVISNNNNNSGQSFNNQIKDAFKDYAYPSYLDLWPVSIAMEEVHNYVNFLKSSLHLKSTVVIVKSKRNDSSDGNRDKKH